MQTIPVPLFGVGMRKRWVAVAAHAPSHVFAGRNRTRTQRLYFEFAKVCGKGFDLSGQVGYDPLIFYSHNINKYSLSSVSNMKRYRSTIFIVFAMLQLVGCLPGPIVSFTKDVTQDEKLWKYYQQNNIYELKVDTFWCFRNNESPVPTQSILVPPKNKTKGKNDLLYSAPQSVYDYKIKQDQWPDVKAIITAGTKIQCNKIVEYKPLGYINSYYIYAKIINGPYSGHEVEISDLSLSIFDQELNLYLFAPNLQLMKGE